LIGELHGRLFKFKRIALSIVGLLCVCFIVALAVIVFIYGGVISQQERFWRYYLAAAIPSMFVLLALWFQFNPAVVQYNDFRRSLRLRKP